MLSKALKAFVVLDLIAINIGLGYLIYGSLNPSAVNVVNREIDGTSTEKNTGLTGTDNCGEECVAAIKAEVAKLAAVSATTAGVSPQPTVKVSGGGTAKAKVRSTVYITVPGSGSTTTNDWFNLSGTEFYFDPAEYPGLVEVYFEANMRLFNGNGLAYVRLFDVTHGIGVQGSEAQTNSQTSVVSSSGKVSFWSGRNLFRVQVKSLTADTAIFDSGRIRVVTEN